MIPKDSLSRRIGACKGNVEKLLFAFFNMEFTIDYSVYVIFIRVAIAYLRPFHTFT